MLKVKEKSDLNSPTFNLSNKIVRLLWQTFYCLFFKYSPIPLHKYRAMVLNLFGAKISKDAKIYPSTKIWLPSNLKIGRGSSIGPNVNLYNQGQINIGNNTIISQGAHLCASTHDYKNLFHPLILAPILVEDNVWVCAEAFIGPNVKLSKGCVVGARSVVTKDTIEFSVNAGNPAKFIKNREFNISER